MEIVINVFTLAKNSYQFEIYIQNSEWKRMLDFVAYDAFSLIHVRDLRACHVSEYCIACYRRIIF